jgi:tetratricopeptide (TPR) repeat protein
MKKLMAMLFLGSLAGCNMFSPLEVSRDALDSCKALSDNGQFTEAMEECQKAIDADPTNMEAHLEFADASLASLGIDIATLSDIFLNKTDGTDTIIALAEGILAQARITQENKTQSLTTAEDAITAFDNYGILLIAENPTDGPQVASFYRMLARLCNLTILMAYADLGPNGDASGTITKAEICGDASCGNPICESSTTDCKGMDNADALSAGNLIKEIKDSLASIGLPDVQKSVEEMSDILVPDPDALPIIDEKPIDQIAPGFWGDAGRQILFDIAR